MHVHVSYMCMCLNVYVCVLWCIVCIYVTEECGRGNSHKS